MRGLKVIIGIVTIGVALGVTYCYLNKQENIEKNPIAVFTTKGFSII